MSPIVVKDWTRLPELRRLVAMNYSKRAYHSIKGLAEHNYQKYIINERDDSIKRCNTIGRMIIMNPKLLRDGVIEYSLMSATLPNDNLILFDELDFTLKHTTILQNTK